ncbi:739_t:CDS:10 [Paraglomus occultum]|uniref:739_t:CDS:1 n=1 Tax=Paraglomus occultum TaxID=144539 RepID=A0A9N8ZBB7_9GLOM|nr:739_t:CDS:10 [Paraglomus occultum]
MEDSSEHAVVVKFRSTGKDFNYNFDPAQLTVRQLKERLTTKTSIPADSMRLVYSGRVLKDEDTVELYGVKAGHTIYVVKIAANRAAEQAANASTTTTATSTTATPTTLPSTRGSNNVSGNPFGANLFGFGSGLDPDVMRSVMNSPMLRHLLSNPEIVRSMMMQNPTMRQMIERNPEIGHIINDPSFIRQTMDMARNPELMREMMRNNDRALANLETIPGGFNHLRRMYHTLQEPLDSAGRNNDQLSEIANQRLAQLLNVESPPEGQINSTPLPNPWAPRNNNLQTQVGNPFANIFPVGVIPLSNQTPFLTSNSSRNQSPHSSIRSSTSSPSTSQSTNNTTGPGQSSNNSPFPIPGMPMPADPDFIRRLQQTAERLFSHQYTTSQQSQRPNSYSTSMFNPNPLLMTMQSPFGNASPPAPQQNTDPPQTRFRDQLRRLEEMGFHDQALNIRALFAAGGDVTSAIDWLLQNLN